MFAWNAYEAPEVDFIMVDTYSTYTAIVTRP